MADVFVSYAREDKARVTEIADALKSLGLDVWSDREILPGGAYHRAINTELHNAKAVIVCWTSFSCDSEFVNGEATIGREAGKLVTLRLDQCKLGPPWNVDHTEDLTDWSGDWSDQGWQRIIERIGGLVGRLGLTRRKGLPSLCEARSDATGSQLAKWAKSYPDDPYAAVALSDWGDKQKLQFSADLTFVRDEVQKAVKKFQSQAKTKIRGLEEDFEKWLAMRSGAKYPDPRSLMASLVGGFRPPEPMSQPVIVQPKEPKVYRISTAVLLVALVLGGAAIAIRGSDPSPGESTAKIEDLEAKLARSSSDQIAADTGRDTAIRERDAAKNMAITLTQQLSQSATQVEAEDQTAKVQKGRADHLQTLLDTAQHDSDANRLKADDLTQQLQASTASLDDSKREAQVASNRVSDLNSLLVASQRERDIAVAKSVDDDREVQSLQRRAIVAESTVAKVQKQIDDLTKKLKGPPRRTIPGEKSCVIDGINASSKYPWAVLRDAPNASAYWPPALHLINGTRLTVLDDRGDYYHVRLADGKEGYTTSKFIVCDE